MSGSNTSTLKELLEFIKVYPTVTVPASVLKKLHDDRRRLRAELAFCKLYDRLNTLHSHNCSNPKVYRGSLLRRLGVVMGELNKPYNIENDCLIKTS